MPDFKFMAQAARARMKPAQRRKSRKRIPTWLFPVATERKYARGLEEASGWMARFFQELRAIVGRYKADGFSDDLRAWVASADAAALAMFAPDGPVLKLISEVGIDAYLFNAGQWGKATEALVGFRYSTPEGWWDDMLKDWTEENVQYLEAATAETRARASALAMRAVRTGMPAEELAEALAKLLGGYTNRLRLIAADQMGNLNGLITKKRQTEAGIEVYSWQTKQDERVRGRPGGKYPDAVPSHWEMQGMWCKWSDSSVYADPDVDVVRDERGDIVSISWQPRNALMPLAIPGEATRCRCTASPVWESFLAGEDGPLEGDLSTNEAFDRYLKDNYGGLDMGYPKFDMTLDATNSWTGQDGMEAIHARLNGRGLASAAAIKSGKADRTDYLIRLLEGHIADRPLPSDVALYRGLSDAAGDISVGSRIKSLSFQAFSSDPAVALRFAQGGEYGNVPTVMTWRATKGSPVAPLVIRTSDGRVVPDRGVKEFLAQHGSSFEVMSVEVRDGVKYVEVKRV